MCVPNPHVVILCHVLPSCFPSALIRGNCGTSVTTPFGLDLVWKLSTLVRRPGYTVCPPDFNSLHFKSRVSNPISKYIGLWVKP